MKEKKYDEVLGQDELALLAESNCANPVDCETKSKIKFELLQRISALCPKGGQTVRASQGAWFELNDHISIKILHQDHKKKQQTALWRLKPGAVIIGHKHENDEECLVMEGSIRMNDYELHAGDFHVMKKGSYHPNLVCEHGALLYLKHDMHEHIVG